MSVRTLCAIPNEKTVTSGSSYSRRSMIRPGVQSALGAVGELADALVDLEVAAVHAPRTARRARARARARESSCRKTSPSQPSSRAAPAARRSASVELADLEREQRPVPAGAVVVEAEQRHAEPLGEQLVEARDARAEAAAVVGDDGLDAGCTARPDRRLAAAALEPSGERADLRRERAPARRWSPRSKRRPLRVAGDAGTSRSPGRAAASVRTRRGGSRRCRRRSRCRPARHRHAIGSGATAASSSVRRRRTGARRAHGHRSA